VAATFTRLDIEVDRYLSEKLCRAVFRLSAFTNSPLQTGAALSMQLFVHSSRVVVLQLSTGCLTLYLQFVFVVDVHVRAAVAHFGVQSTV